MFLVVVLLLIDMPMIGLNMQQSQVGIKVRGR